VTFLTPLYAAIAAAIAIPTLLILYFLKLRRQELEISSTLLWKKAIQDLQANAPFQKLRRNILLLLQLLALAAAILALGQPQFNASSLVGQRHVILIDRSASMATLDAGGERSPISRLDAAKDAAASFVQGLREPGLFDRDAGDLAMVIAFDREAAVIQQFTGDKRKLEQAIRSITPSDGPSNLEPAVRLARAQAPKLFLPEDNLVIEGISDRWPISLQVFTDGRLPDADRATPGPSDTVVFHRLGKPDTGNLGVIALRADREFDDPSKVSVFAAVQNTFPQPRRIDVQLSVDGVPAGIKELTVPPLADGRGGTQGIAFPLSRAEGATIEVRLLQPPGSPGDLDSFSTDDRATLVIQPAKSLRLALVTSGNLLLRYALESLPQSGDPKVLSPAEYEAALRSGQAFDFDVVVLDGIPVAWRDKKNTLPPGRYLVFNHLPNTIDPASLPDRDPATPPRPLGPVLIDRGPAGPSSVVSWRRDHRALRSVNLDTLDIFESRQIDIPEGSSVQSLAESTAGPIIVELSTSETRALVVGFDPAASDWPQDLSFIIFLSYATDYLGTGGGWAVVRSSQPGLTVSDRLPDNASLLECSGPAGISVGAGLASDGSASFGPFPRVGIYTASWRGSAAPGDRTRSGRVERDFAVNLLDPVESDVRSAEQITLATQEASASQADTASVVRSLWPWLLLAALSVVVLEWYIYNRKVHV
jgi:hypothetical protein